MYCQACGKKIKGNERFCGRCGARIASEMSVSNRGKNQRIGKNVILVGVSAVVILATIILIVFAFGSKKEKRVEGSIEIYDGTILELTQDEYIIADSDKYMLEEKDIKGFSKEKCSFARNEIYARHGRRFKDAKLQTYFDSKSWYKGSIDADDFDNDVLNACEKSNVQLLYAYEKKMGYR